MSGKKRLSKGKPEVKYGWNEPFTLRIINSLTYENTQVTVTKSFTLLDIQLACTHFEDHPEYYLWQDMYGSNLELEKTVVENGLVGKDEVVEFDGLQKLPVIILVFKDGFENETSKPLNPMDRTNWDKGLCQ